MTPRGLSPRGLTPAQALLHALQVARPTPSACPSLAGRPNPAARPSPAVRPNPARPNPVARFDAPNPAARLHAPSPAGRRRRAWTGQAVKGGPGRGRSARAGPRRRAHAGAVTRVEALPRSAAAGTGAASGSAASPARAVDRAYTGGSGNEGRAAGALSLLRDRTHLRDGAGAREELEPTAHVFLVAGGGGRLADRRLGCCPLGGRGRDRLLLRKRAAQDASQDGREQQGTRYGERARGRQGSTHRWHGRPQRRRPHRRWPNESP